MDKMSTDQEVKTSNERLRLAAAKINQLGIVASPKNYTIWYEYFAGINKQLREDIDKLFEEKHPFTDEVTEQLYEQHFSHNGDQSLVQLRHALKELINKLGDELSRIWENMGSYETTLLKGEAAFQKDPDVKALLDIIQMLLKETKAQQHNARNALNDVISLKEEIDFLKQSLEQMSEEVYIDALTGIPNRRSYDNEITRLLGNSRDNERQICLLLLDIDHFKHFNDEYGHIVGDRVLSFVATMITKNIKGGDFAARYGGEEFIVILPNTDYQGGKTVAKTILKNIARAKLKVGKGGKKINAVTLSAGVAILRQDDTSQSIFERADSFLIEAKRAGRNTVLGERD